MSDNPIEVRPGIDVTIRPETVGIDSAIQKDLLLRVPDSINTGFFHLMDSVLIVEGVNVANIGRCDNLTYGIKKWTDFDESEIDGLMFGKNIPYTDEIFGPGHIKHIYGFSHVPGVFGFCFTEFAKPELEKGSWSEVLKVGRTFGELLKVMHEWSLLVDEPFNSTHAFSVLCKRVFDFLQPPKKIMDEIKSYPDMHLVRFLRGDKSHRDLVEDFPEMSTAMKKWVVSVVENNTKMSFDEVLDKI